MNRRFHEVSRQQNNVNLDRNFFNANTRQDKDWQQQSQKPNQQLNKHDVNADRAFFNINTNAQFSYADKNRQMVDRQFNNYTVQNSIRNKDIYNDTGKRIYAANTRDEKNPLELEQNTFINRSVNSNPYAKDTNIGVTRLQSIDTKNGEHGMYKKMANEPQQKNKFNPFAMY